MKTIWPRAVALGAAVIVAALLLKVAPPWAVLAVFVVGFVVAYVVLQRRAKASRRPQAEPDGLQRASTDPFGILGYPLLLLSRAADPAIEDVVWGRWRAIDVHAFGLAFGSPPVLDRPAERTAYACAMTRLEAELPALVAEPQLFAASLADPPSVGTVETGDPPFDRAMRVWARDAAVAHEVLDPAMRAWLGSLEPGWGVELGGHLAMVYGPRPEEPDVVPVLEVLLGLLSHLPTGRGAARPPAV
jgi:hypothetical protein